MLPRKPRWTLWPTRSWQNKPLKRVKSEKTSCPHTGCDKITRYAGSFLSGCRTAARGRECSVILARKPELRRKFRSDGTARHITGDLLKYILAVGNDKSVFADHLCQLGSVNTLQLKAAIKPEPKEMDNGPLGVPHGRQLLRRPAAVAPQTTFVVQVFVQLKQFVKLFFAAARKNPRRCVRIMIILDFTKAFLKICNRTGRNRKLNCQFFTRNTAIISIETKLLTRKFFTVYHWKYTIEMNQELALKDVEQVCVILCGVGLSMQRWPGT